jgi:DASS family divalent anion:Na+ symporter
MFSGMASISLSSALWLTSQAANPLGAAMARNAGVDISFGSWILASSVPTVIAMLVLPWLLQRVIRPEVTSTPDAPAAAKARVDRSRAVVARRAHRRVAFVEWWHSGRWRDRLVSIRRDSRCWDSAVLLSDARVDRRGHRERRRCALHFIWFAVLFALSGQTERNGIHGFRGPAARNALAAGARFRSISS